MSFDKEIDGHIVKFKEEDDYLQCRIQFLQRERMDIFAPSFLQFIKQCEYDDRCIVESVEKSSVLDGAWQGSSLIGNDYYYGGSVSGTIDTSTMDTTSFINTSTSYYHNTDTGYLVAVDGNFIIPPAAPEAMDKVKIEDTPEDPPEDPIENRWDILDL